MKFQRTLSVALCIMLMCSLCSGFAAAATEKYAYAPLTVTFEDANCEIELTFSQASVGHSLLVSKSYAYEMEEMGKMFMAEYDINENGEMVYMTTQEDVIVVKDSSDVQVNILRAEPKAAGSGGIGTTWDVRGTVSWFAYSENEIAMMYCDSPSDPENAAKFMKSGQVEQLLGAAAEATKGYSTDWVCLRTSNGLVLTESYYESILGSIGQDVPDISAQPTYGQATVRARGYTIENDIGYFLIDVTNPNPTSDTGDLFWVTYAKYDKDYGLVDGGSFVPTDYIRQIRYEVDGNDTITLRVATGAVFGVDSGDSETWYEETRVVDHRIVLAQAETIEEAEELADFFGSAHYYPEMELSGWNDAGVRCLALPASTKYSAAYLDQKLSWFTSQF